MAELGALFESLGHTEVRTVIQSGNVIFSSEMPATPRNLEIAIHEAFGVDITVVLRTPAELARRWRRIHSRAWIRPSST